MPISRRELYARDPAEVVSEDFLKPEYEGLGKHPSFLPPFIFGENIFDIYRRHRESIQRADIAEMLETENLYPSEYIGSHTPPRGIFVDKAVQRSHRGVSNFYRGKGGSNTSIDELLRHSVFPYMELGISNPFEEQGRARCLADHPSLGYVFQNLVDFSEKSAMSSKSAEDMSQLKKLMEDFFRCFYAISEEDLAELMEFYLAKIHEKIRVFETELSLIVESIMQKIKYRCTEYGLSAAEMAERLAGEERVLYRVADSLLSVDDKEDSLKSGESNHYTRTIRIHIYTPKDAVTSTVAHELFHAYIAGLNASTAVREDESFRWIEEEIGMSASTDLDIENRKARKNGNKITKAGLCLYPRANRHPEDGIDDFFLQAGDARFVWLNEAVTEHSKDLLLNSDRERGNDGAYQDCLKLYDLLKVAGKEKLGDDIFFKAYAEEYDPSLPKQDQFSHMRNLFRSIKQSFSDHPRILSTIDTFCKNNDTAGAILFLSNVSRYYHPSQ